MARDDLSAGMVTAIERDTADACHLISAAFGGGVLYFSTGSVDISWDGHTWVAIGGNLRVEAVSEAMTLSAQGVRVHLDGVDQTVISALLSENYVGRACEVYLLHNASTGGIVADPYLMFSGLLNSPFEVRMTGNTCTVSTRFVSPLTRFKERRGIKATVISHQQHFNGDTFFRHIKGIANREIWWGPQPVRPGGGGHGVGGGGGTGDVGNDDRGNDQGGEF